MKKAVYLLVLSAVVYSCGKKGPSATYVPRTITVTEKFNDSNDQADSALKIVKYTADEKEEAASKDLMAITFRDTLVNIKLHESDSGAVGKFGFAEFINTQKTAILAQISDNSGLTAPFFVIALKDGKLDVVSLYRPSNGKMDSEFTKGQTRIGRNGYLVNNDFFVANVNAKVYILKRQKPEERIQGEFLGNSPDRTTLAFLTSQTSSVYQTNYVSGEVLDQPLSKEALEDAYRYVQKNFTWQPNKNGTYFFKPGSAENPVDISSFK
ncbi:hypothetical protein [Pedobacter sp. JY14-1]|uniref:hypothetical protein n=1 Tax=Pedobacter sp. JY14-1 TaxID=3034151 RepID=UPI0023E223FD|nr:hypothetical protein [Pedobacter sp. JY14-1]